VAVDELIYNNAFFDLLTFECLERPNSFLSQHGSL